MLVTDLDKLMSLDSRGKFGRSGGFGNIRFGYNFFGFYSPFCAIYSRKKTVKGWGLSRMKFYRPSNPQTVPQQNWRTTFANGMTAWSALSTLDKEYFNGYGKKYKMNGCNVFMKWYLQENH